jgi:hypothetical protein
MENNKITLMIEEALDNKRWDDRCVLVLPTGERLPFEWHIQFGYRVRKLSEMIKEHEIQALIKFGGAKVEVTFDEPFNHPAFRKWRHFTDPDDPFNETMRRKGFAIDVNGHVTFTNGPGKGNLIGLPNCENVVEAVTAINTLLGDYIGKQ